MNPSRALLRLLALFAVSFGLIGLSPLGLLLLAVFVAVWALSLQRHNIGLLLQRIWRMRWFFLAIGILYGLGMPQQDSWAAWSQAVYRVGVLMILVTTVGLCLQDLPPRELANGIVSLLRPLALLGVPIDSFARRLAMSLNAVQLMDDKLRSMPRANRHEALDSVAQLCWSAENWSPPMETQNTTRSPATRADLLLLVLVVAALLGLRWLA